MRQLTDDIEYNDLPESEAYHIHKPHCLECGKEMVYGRPDRKFCSPECKNRWHNRSYSAPRLTKIRVQHILEKNYRILVSFMEAGITMIPISSLLVMGFNPLYYTSSIKQRKGQLCMCFDLKYTLTSTKLFKLEFVDKLPK